MKPKIDLVTRGMVARQHAQIAVLKHIVGALIAHQANATERPETFIISMLSALANDDLAVETSDEASRLFSGFASEFARDLEACALAQLRELAP